MSAPLQRGHGLLSTAKSMLRQSCVVYCTWRVPNAVTRNIFKKDIRRWEDDDFMNEKLYNGCKTFIFHQIHVKYN